MVRVTGPLFSLGARGTIATPDPVHTGKAGYLTFKRRPKGGFSAGNCPTHPDGAKPGQLAWREVFKEAVALWHGLTVEEKAELNRRGDPRNMTGYMLWLKEYLTGRSADMGAAHNAVYKVITTGDKTLPSALVWTPIDDVNYAIDFVSTGALAVVFFQVQPTFPIGGYLYLDIEVDGVRLGQTLGIGKQHSYQYDIFNMYMLFSPAAGSRHIRVVYKCLSASWVLGSAATSYPAILAAWEVP